MVKDCTVLELGGGTGIVSIVAAMAAKRVYCTGIWSQPLSLVSLVNVFFLSLKEQSIKLRHHQY